MNPRVSSLLLAIALAACSSTTLNDAGFDAGADAGADVPADVALDTSQDARVDVPTSCDLSVVYTYGPDGGFTPTRETVRLEPGRRFTFTRTPLGGVDAGACMCSCTTVLDECGMRDGGSVDTRSVLDAFADPAVSAAFGDQTNTVYGRDSRPVDGQVFMVTRGDGRHFEVGGDCAGETGCRAIPAGLSRLRTVLTDLRTQELARPACAALGS